MRRVLIVVVLGSWLFMLGLLVKRSMLEPAVPVDGSVPVSDSAEWMGVYQESEKIGYVEQRLQRTADGYELTQRTLLRLNILDTRQTVRSVVRASAGDDLSLRAVSFELDGGVGSFRAAGTVGGEELRLRVETGGEVTESSIPLPAPIYLPALLRASLRGGRLRAGEELQALLFDPMSLRNERIRVRVEGWEPVPGAERSAWRVREEFRGLRTTAWVDKDGTVLREEGPMGMVLVREPMQVAVAEGWTEGTALDLVARVAVPVHPPIHGARERLALRVRVQGVDVEEVPTDEEQMRAGDVLTVRRLPLRAGDSYPLPYTGSERAEELRATVFLQSNHERVRRRARDVLGQESDALSAAKLLSEWVYGALHKVPTVSLPNALQVLDMRAGDCNEHAILFTALARAAGLPARVVAGVVYMDGAFLYHAWAEVWLGRWVSVDPVLGQLPADATHIKFVVGGPEEHFAMMGIIGRLRMQVLDSAGGDDARVPRRG